MDNTNKYIGILLIVLGGFIGMTLLLVIIFFLLKFTSVALVKLPGFQGFFEYVVTIAPYLVFLGAYYYIRNKIISSPPKTTRTISAVLLIMGILVCFAAFTLVNLKFFGLQRYWLIAFDDNSQYVLILQLLIVFLSAGCLALGDPKEEDWLEKRKKKEA